MCVKRKEASTQMDLYAHLPVEDNAPDEPQGQLVVSIHNVRPSYVYQINLKMKQERTTDAGPSHNVAFSTSDLLY